MAWWDSIGFYKKITAIAAMITAVLAAMFAVANALQAGEPHWLATRGFVREYIAQASAKYTADQQQLKVQQTQTEIQVLQGRIDTIKAKISDRELLLQKQEGPFEYRQLVQEQINSYKDVLDRLNEQLKQLRDRH